MIDFISQYGFAILYIIVALISFIVTCSKKAKVEIKDTPFEKLMAELPSLIIKAEQMVGEKNGQRKKFVVLGVAYNYLSDLIGESVETIAQKYGKRIDDAVEKILETPQKKGIEIYDDKKKNN